MAKKILFSDRYGLTQAVLEGRKTMTRRIATELNHPNITEISEWGVDNNGNAMLLITYDTGLEKDVYPHFQIGEIVAVAQAYKNDDVLSFNAYLPDGLKRHKEMLSSAGYRNKMFVKAKYMPHRIRITNIKVERLQNITEGDVYKEGFSKESVNNGWGNAAWHWEAMLIYYDGLGRTREIRSRKPKEAFSFLIDRISGKGTWMSNPWVFAYEFELVK